MTSSNKSKPILPNLNMVTYLNNKSILTYRISHKIDSSSLYVEKVIASTDSSVS